MKNSILFALILFLSFSLSAQEETITPPKFVLGGQFNIQNSNLDADGFELNEFSLAASPYLGFQVNSHWLVGGQLLLSIENSETDFFFGSEEDKSTAFGIGGFARYSLTPDNKFTFFFQPSISLLFGNTEFEEDGSSTDEFDQFGFNIGISPGVTYQIGDKFRLLLSLQGINYTNLTLESEDEEIDVSVFTFDVGPSNLVLGAEFLF